MLQSCKTVAFFAGISLCLISFFPTIAFAGGGPGNETVTTMPPTIQTTSQANPPVQTGSNGLVGAVTQINPITPLQTNSSFYSNTTQFSSSNSGNNCGLSVGLGTNNSNTTLEKVFSSDIRYNTNPCPDYSKLKTIEQEGETRRVKIYVQGNVIRDCANFRTQLIQAGKNPDGACKVPDLSQMDSLLH